MSQCDIDEIFRNLCSLVSTTGEYVRSATSITRSSTQAKENYADLVTEYDQNTETKLISGLSSLYPDHRFIGEEGISSGKQVELTDSPTWIIDPIDGTTNFVHSFPFYCISVALYINKEPQIGLVYDVPKDIMYSAIRGRGAYRNGKPLRVSSQRDLSQALIIAEFGNQRDQPFLDFKVELMAKLIKECHGIRCLGSAALNCCYVAEGSADASYEFGLHIWDMAAGYLIATEAGAVVSSPTGGPVDLLSRKWLVASNQKLATQMQGLMSDYPVERD